MSGGGGGGGSSAATAQADTEEGRELYREQAGLAREQAGLLRESRPLLEEQTGLLREQAATARELRAMGREQWDIYKEHGLGALKDLGERVDRYASKGRIAQQEGMAAADVKASYGNQRASFFRNLGRYGARPGSGRFASSLRALALGEAGDTAGAKTRTRTGILDRDLANRFGLSAAWQGRDSSAMAGLGQSAAQLGAAGMGLGSGYSRMASGLGQAGQGLGQAAGGFMNNAASMRQSDAIAQGGMWSGLGALAGSLGGAWILASDERLKTDIKPIGKAAEDVVVYSFKYLDEPSTTYTGVIAQELIRTRPHLVVVSPANYLFVNYSRLFEEIFIDEYKEAA